MSGIFVLVAWVARATSEFCWFSLELVLFLPLPDLRHSALGRVRYSSGIMKASGSRLSTECCRLFVLEQRLRVSAKVNVSFEGIRLSLNVRASHFLISGACLFYFSSFFSLERFYICPEGSYPGNLVSQGVRLRLPFCWCVTLTSSDFGLRIAGPRKVAGFLARFRW